MDTRIDAGTPTKAWWLAVVALVCIGPWPSWRPPWWSLLVAVALVLWLAKPRRSQWLAWIAVGAGVAISLGGRGAAELDRDRLARQLEDHCRGMLQVAERIASDPELASLYAASGEITDPAMPFRLLDRELGGVANRTAYLADDRGRLVAWGGAQNLFPVDVRPIGPRRWGQTWSALGVVHYLREPILLEGHMVGAVTVADSSPLTVRHAFGMTAPRHARLVLGRSNPAAFVVAPSFPPGVRLPLAVRDAEVAATSEWSWVPWIAVAALGLVFAPGASLAAVSAGTLSWLLTGHGLGNVGWAVLILGAGAVLARVTMGCSPRWAKMIVIAALLVAALLGVWLRRPDMASWLPLHLARPGWGAVWMVALAWVVSGWPSLRRGSLSLLQGLGLSGFLAVLAVLIAVIRIPVDLVRAFEQTAPPELPAADLRMTDLLPVEPERCDLRDMAPFLARRWQLDRWPGACQLVLVDRDGLEISRWGELAPVGDQAQLVASWQLPELGSSSLELWSVGEPWSLIRDWRNEPSRGLRPPVWFVAFTRAGKVAAGLAPTVKPIDTMVAGELFHGNGGWIWLRVGESRRPALVRRSGDWLVAAVARSSTASDWVVRAAIASLWSMLGLLIARPPAFRREQLATFGGRLRLLVAGGVVFPLVVLTLFLQLRFQDEQKQREHAAGLEALRSARYTAEHLSGGFAVDDDLARWIAAGWGGEVVLYDGAEVVAISRPDYMQLGWIPALPTEAGFINYLLGNQGPVAARYGGEMAAAGAVELGGRRLLLQMFRPGRGEGVETPVAVDWLLTGAVLSALLALALSSRVERRLSVSLNDLVALARRLLHGEPVGVIRRPQETDLAEVLDAVRSMNQEVQQRELSLRHQEELLRITLATLSQAVVVLDPEGELRFSNPAAEKLREQHGELMARHIQTVAEAEADLPAAATVAPLPGADLTWRIGVAPVPLPDGRRGVVAVIDDVSDVVRADRLRQLAQLARIVAHEVKNPLTPIRLWVQELDAARKRGAANLDELLEEACSEIAGQVERLQMTASSFSNLVALEHWDAARVDLTLLLREAVTGLSILERRGIRLELQLPAAGGCWVMGDRQWLARALGNLVLNSIHAIGDRAGELRVSLSCDGEVAVVEVEDSAGGVPEVQLGDLFSPHFSTTTAGSGLGLALVHNVVTRCQGTVAAFNGVRGLVVRLELPRMVSTAVEGGDEGAGDASRSW